MFNWRYDKTIGCWLINKIKYIYCQTMFKQFDSRTLNNIIFFISKYLPVFRETLYYFIQIIRHLKIVFNMARFWRTKVIHLQYEFIIFFQRWRKPIAIRIANKISEWLTGSYQTRCLPLWCVLIEVTYWCRNSSRLTLKNCLLYKMPRHFYCI